MFLRVNEGKSKRLDDATFERISASISSCASQSTKFSPNAKFASVKLEKLLLSAISNWENKNEGKRKEEAKLYVKEIFVNQGRTLKRLRPAPQGRAHRIRKRSNHVTLILGDNIN